MRDAIVIENAAKAGYMAYFGVRPGRSWPEPPAWTPEKQTWLEFAARILIGELTSPKAAYEWWIEIRFAKGWDALSREQRAIWGRVFDAIQEENRVAMVAMRNAATWALKAEAKAAA